MNLFRKILILDKERTITLPEEFIGKEIEVIAFPLINIKSNQIRKISSEEFFKDKLVDLSDYKFDRLEANHYE